MEFLLKEKLSAIDRFIPQRIGMNHEVANYNLGYNSNQSISSIDIEEKFVKETFVNTAKYAHNISNYKKLLWQSMCPHSNKILKLSSSTKSRKEKSIQFHKESIWPVIPRKEPLIGKPFTVLDLPDIDTTVYHHVIDWGKQGHIAAIFHGEVHVWDFDNSVTGSTDTQGSILSCVKWNRPGTKFAVARIGSSLSVVDAKTLKIKNSFACQCSEIFGCTITAIEWTKKGIIIAGCSEGSLFFTLNKNQAKPMYLWKVLSAEIINIKLSCNESYLLVSALNGKTIIFNWPLSWNCQPEMVFRGLDACGNGFIKSTAWHPWKESLLAVSELHGASVAIWNVKNQKLVDCNTPTPIFKKDVYIDCLAFNPLSAELLISFYYEDPNPNTNTGYNILSVFSDLWTIVDEVKFHAGRTPHALWNGSGTKLAVASADENLSIWNFFGSDSYKEKLCLTKKGPTTDFFETVKRFKSSIR